MAQAYAERQHDSSFRLDHAIGALLFVPCIIVWTIGVLCMLPITILAFPAQYLFANNPKFHGDVVTGLVILGAANALITPAAVLCTIYA